MPERVLALAHEISNLVTTGLTHVERCTSRTKVLSINARIEAARSGLVGKGFEVVASEMNEISKQIDGISEELRAGLEHRLSELDVLGQRLIANVRGARFADLALNMIDVIDRNLYERSCDVRWWATDSAVVRCLEEGSQAAQAHAAKRLGVILDSYTVYLDLWIADKDGHVVSNGRSRYSVVGMDVSKESWFRDALASHDGSQFSVADIHKSRALEEQNVAMYGAAIRRGGETNGEVLGVLGIAFDWQRQASAVVKGVRLTDDERARSRALLIDSRHVVIAASDGRGVLQERYPLRANDKTMGNYEDGAKVVGFALTPGYETYRGLGWYGVIELSR